MKFYKRLGIYKGNSGNVTFNPLTIEAHSYRWWRFVAKVDGLVVFNSYRYSNTTSKHQAKVRSLLQELGIRIDLFVKLNKGIEYQSIPEMIQQTEEFLCNEFLDKKLKAQESYARTKRRKLVKAIEDKLENEFHFRDYEILHENQFGKINQIGVHRIVSPENVEYDLNDAINTFVRDGFPRILFYVGGES